MVSQQQLSLFDTATVVKPTYKVGDLVKIRKRPIGASYVKKGDVVEIVAVHPLNGSIKFWNERSERGEFLHPDEIGSIVSPDDSPTPAEVAVGESNCPSDMDYLDPISAYKPKGTARGNENYRYYRLSYKEGNKVRQVHIRGGNTDSPIAQAKVQEVRSLLVAGFSPAEIAATLKLKASNL